jgi:hypothetical protein
LECNPEGLIEELVDHVEKKLPTLHEKINLIMPDELLDYSLISRINHLCCEARNLEP